MKEELTGQVNGVSASDLEERFANALSKFRIGFWFQVPIRTEYTLPDNEKMLDFLVFNARRAWPVEIYGAYFHTSAGDKLKDAERERQLNVEFRERGWEDLTTVQEYEVFDQEQANNTVKRLFV